MEHRQQRFIAWVGDGSGCLSEQTLRWWEISQQHLSPGEIDLHLDAVNAVSVSAA
jgi:hypothetical protein